MKILLILRHAQSVHFGDTSDHDRALTDRGEEDATRMGRLFRGIRPTLILCSTAKRALCTAELVTRAAGLNTRIETLRSLYDSDTLQHLSVLGEVAADVDSILLVGHNPTFEQLASTLVRRPITMKTGALAVIALPIASWEHVSRGGNLVGLFYPGMLKKHLEE